MRILVAMSILASAAIAETPDEEFQALQAEHRKAQQEFFRPWREARQKGESFQLDYSKHPDRTFGARFQALAAKHPGTDAAAKALVQVLRLGPAKAKALETLLEAHIESAALKDAIGVLRWQPNGAAALKTIAEKSPHHEVRGLALLAHGQALKSTDPAGALTIFEQVKERYADVPYFRRTTLGRKADGEIFELTALAIGKSAPEIEGEDIDGNPMKLSDFRGKVVVLNFWGDW